jgi:transcriptional regulator with XRE-family HTH domain
VAEPVDVTLLGEHLKRARTEREATLKKVAGETEVSIATLSRIERGEAKGVDSPTLMALSKWIGVDAKEFLTRPEVELPKLPPRKQGTPDVVELHLRADRNLDRQTAITLAKMFRAAYESLATTQKRGGAK